jgi:hypothetical protein
MKSSRTFCRWRRQNSRGFVIGIEWCVGVPGNCSIDGYACRCRPTWIWTICNDTRFAAPGKSATLRCFSQSEPACSRAEAASDPVAIRLAPHGSSRPNCRSTQHFDRRAIRFDVSDGSRTDSYSLHSELHNRRPQRIAYRYDRSFDARDIATKIS